MTHSIPLKPWEVRGILDGWLRQLVRPVHLSFPRNVWERFGTAKTDAGEWFLVASTEEDKWAGVMHIECPFGKSGDVLWAQEPWELRMDNLPGCSYEADWIRTPIGKLAEWKDAEGMPRECSRLSILNVETKVESLQDFAHSTCGSLYVESNVVGLARRVEQWNLDYPETPWESNPWCWVATIRKAET